MNTAISIPDPIFETAEHLAQTLRISRNELYTRALTAYIETFGENTLEKEDEDWENFYLLHRDEFRIMAQDALKELHMGATAEMLIVDGRMTFK